MTSLVLKGTKKKSWIYDWLKKISFYVPCTCRVFGVASLCINVHLWSSLFAISLTAMTALCQMLRRYSVVMDIAALGEVVVLAQPNGSCGLFCVLFLWWNAEQ